MKRYISMITVVAFLFTSTAAVAYQAECMNPKGKFSSCKVEISDGILKIQYRAKQWKDSDREINGNQITALAGGEYARRRVAESITSAVLLGPLFLFALFAKKKRDNFGIEYITSNGHKDNVMIQVEKKYGFALGQQLQTISGQTLVLENAASTAADDKQAKNKGKTDKNEPASGQASSSTETTLATASDDESPVKKKGNKYR